MYTCIFDNICEGNEDNIDMAYKTKRTLPSFTIIMALGASLQPYCFTRRRSFTAEWCGIYLREKVTARIPYQSQTIEQFLIFLIYLRCHFLVIVGSVVSIKNLNLLVHSSAMDPFSRILRTRCERLLLCSSAMQLPTKKGKVF